MRPSIIFMALTFIALVSTTKTLNQFDSVEFQSMVRAQVLEALSDLKILDTDAIKTMAKDVTKNVVNATVDKTNSIVDNV